MCGMQLRLLCQLVRIGPACRGSGTARRLRARTAPAAVARPARTVQKLLHAHVVRFKEACAAPPYLCIVMEYVSGGSAQRQVLVVCKPIGAPCTLCAAFTSAGSNTQAGPTLLPGGDLLDYINAQRSGVAEDEARYIFQQLVRSGTGEASPQGWGGLWGRRKRETADSNRVRSISRTGRLVVGRQWRRQPEDAAALLPLAAAR